MIAFVTHSPALRPAARGLALATCLWVCGAAGVASVTAQTPPSVSQAPVSQAPASQAPASQAPVSPAAAQSTARDPGAQDPAQPPEPVRLERYDPLESRPAFASIDQNSDDRLDVFEVRRALGNLDFGQFDLDRDGFHSFPEFDNCYRSATRAGGIFEFQPATPMRTPFDPTIPAVRTPGDQLLEIVDTNRNGRISSREFLVFQEFVATVSTPMVVTYESLDTDSSGVVEGAEIAVLFASLPGGGVPLLQRYAQDPRYLPHPYRLADKGGDGTLNADELSIALVVIDPTLARWSHRIVENADTTGDGALSRAELERAESGR